MGTGTAGLPAHDGEAAGIEREGCLAYRSRAQRCSAAVSIKDDALLRSMPVAGELPPAPAPILAQVQQRIALAGTGPRGGTEIRTRH